MRLGVRLYSQSPNHCSYTHFIYRTFPLNEDKSRTVDYLRLLPFCLSPVGIECRIEGSSSNQYGMDVVDSWKHWHEDDDNGSNWAVPC